jgi:hypothetical protein
MLCFFAPTSKRKETLMDINTRNFTVSHAKSMLSRVKSSNTLPFKGVIDPELLNQQMSDLSYRDRIFTPDMTLFAFLSQVMSADQSCQSAVAQVIPY